MLGLLVGLLPLILLMSCKGKPVSPSPEPDDESGPDETPTPGAENTIIISDGQMPNQPSLPPLADTIEDALVLMDVTAARSWTAEILAARTTVAGTPMWLEGDELTFVYHGAARSVRLCCGIQMDMYRVAQTDYWALTVKQAELPRAVVSYTFFVDDQSPIGQTMAVWRGPLAPAPAAQGDYANLQVSCSPGSSQVEM